ncbi:isoprenoid synthase domain-containing protein [Tricladium varicosporioides]|nr:isoprenoid synthase domain-containing protein [Hymenoscyphus varicosporioides]
MIADQATSILLDLRGSQFKVPNMRHLYEGWVSGVSPHYTTIVSFTDEIYENLLPKKDELDKAKACDFGYTSAGWFPSSSLDRLKFMATYCAWFFCWDDSIDREEVTLETGDRYRAEALEYIGYHLGIYDRQSPEPQASTVQLILFANIGKFIREECDPEIAQSFFSELQYIIDCCGKEQMNQLSGQLPTKEEYWDMRYGTSGVYAYCAIAPCMIDVKVPYELFHSPEMRAVWVEMNINIIIFNDIISLKKEVADDAIMSLIPITMAHDGVGLLEATNTVYEELVANCRAFDRAVSVLREKAKEYNEAVKSNIDKLIDCYEAFLTGVMNWSYTNARYKVSQDIQKDGSLVVSL